MTPYRWLIELAFATALIAGILFGVWTYGHKRYEAGAAAQLATDTLAVNSQKAEAVRMIQDRDLQIIALQQANQAQRAQQDKQHAQDQERTDALRRDNAPRVLRVNVPVPGRCGPSRGVDVPSSPASPVSSGTEVVQLPDAVAGNLRQLTVDADTLNDWYRVAYRSLHPDWKEPVSK